MIILAPMEGLVDAPLRDLLTRLGGIDRCVTEFIRVTDRLLPPRVFYRLAPELAAGGRTRSGTPVVVQLLGSDPVALADNAARAAELGAPGIDLNFGCPAKCVNRSQGGAILLKDPDRVGRIVASVRAAVPAAIPVSAKMRLGYEDKSLALANAQAIAGAGAQELCVHARTKLEGYRPPAHWEWIARIRATVAIPVVANGEVWGWEDYQRCREVSGCEAVMLGRGLVSRPDLGLEIQQRMLNAAYQPLGWAELIPWAARFHGQVVETVMPKHAAGRFKQWLAMLARTYPEARQLFDTIRRETCMQRIGALLHAGVATGQSDLVR